ncbi:MAG: hypothetical protein WCT37_03070 [Patescibacteria group bacterium]|jgi:hypothetical protein
MSFFQDDESLNSDDTVAGDDNADEVETLEGDEDFADDDSDDEDEDEDEATEE